SSGVSRKRRRTSSSLLSHAAAFRSFGIRLPLPSFAPLVALQILFDGGLIDLGVEQRALNVAVSQLLAHGREWNLCLQQLAGPAVAQLVNCRFYLGCLTVLLPGVMHHAILQRERTAAIAGIAAKDRARGNPTL